MLTDIINYSLIILFISYFTIYRNLDLNISILLAITSAAPFFLIGVIFPIGYLSDVITYTYFSQYFRSELGLFPEIPSIEWLSFLKFMNSPAEYVGRIFSFVPIPFMDTFRSLGFFNRFLLVIFIIYLIMRNKKINNSIIYFLIFYPTIILYSSLALRDTLILISVLLVVIYLIEKRFFITLPIIYFIFLLRPVNGVIMLILSVLYNFYIRYQNSYSKLISFVIFSVIFTLLIFQFQNDLLNLINEYKKARAAEDLIAIETLSFANNIFELLTYIISFLPKFFFHPYPWDASNIFMLFQSIENIAVVILIIYLFFKSFSIGLLKNLFWLLSLILIAGLFAYVQSNIGGLSRYKFVFISMYICAILYEKQIVDNKNIRKDNKLDI